MKRFDTHFRSFGAWTARSSTLALGAAIAFAAIAAGCGSAISSAEPFGSTGDTGSGTTGAGGGTTGQGGGTTGQGGAAAAEGVPCDVAAVFASACNSCHGANLSGGAPVRLVTYAELTAPSAIDGKTETERSIARMQAGTMPPGGGAPAGEIATLQAWVDDGFQKGSCGGAGGAGAGGAAPDPFAAAPQCSSGNTWKGGASNDMAPGRACNQCHNQQGEGPVMTIAGTVYPTAHEPNNCYAADVTGAVVEVTGADGQKFDLTVNPSSGNFRSHNSQSIKKPYTAKVKYQGRERIMVAAQSEGDCNLCHTQDGTQGAPGRVLLP